jgi:hypothetical protein
LPHSPDGPRLSTSQTDNPGIYIHQKIEPLIIFTFPVG